METTQPNNFESLREDSDLALKESIENLQLPLGIKKELINYILDIKESDDPKLEAHQAKLLEILESVIESGEVGKAGLLFNLHRILTEFRGYGANEKPSSDVKACFNSDLAVPNEGFIVVDRFATRNLPAIVDWCRENQIDLARIRMRVPRMLLAAQMNGMNDEKKAEFNETMSHLGPNAFLSDDEAHVHKIPVDGDIGVLFSPRTLPIMAHMDGGNEEDTIKNYQKLIRGIISKTVPGGRLFINIAVVDNYEPLNARIEPGRKRNFTKLNNQVTRRVADTIIEEFKTAGWNLITAEDRGPLKDYDHEKAINGLHVQRPE